MAKGAANGGAVNWSGAEHYAATEADCRKCGSPTRMRDSTGSPVHKSCFEDELAAEIVGPVGVLVFDELFPPPAQTVPGERRNGGRS